MKLAIVAVTLALGFSSVAQAETAYLVSDQIGQHPSGATVHICTFKTASGAVVQRTTNAVGCPNQIEI
jgi:hypothetical protein